VVNLLFNSWKLFSHSSDHTHFLFFLVSWVKGVAIREKPLIHHYIINEYHHKLIKVWLENPFIKSMKRAGAFVNPNGSTKNS
jgi:hypothetical protein